MAGYNHDQTINAALAALAQGDLSAAYISGLKATQKRADDAEGWSVLGLVLARQGEVHQAKSALNKAIEMEPHEPRWHLHLGSMLHELNDFVAAEGVLRNAVERSNGHVSAMLPWAQTLMSLGRAGDAAQVYGRVLQTAPSPDVWIKAGDALLASQDSVNAVYAYEQAFSDRDRPDTLTSAIADLHIMLGQYSQAENYNNQLRSKKPNDPETGLRAANLLRWKGDLTGARDLQKALWGENKSHAGLTAAMLEEGETGVLLSAKTILDDETNSLNNKRRVAFALTSYHDKIGDDAAAWTYAELANSLYNDVDVSEGNSSMDVEALRELLSKAIIAYHLIPDGDVSPVQMVYQIGAPRSGGSLLQTILSRHEGVKSVGERGALMGWLPQLLDDPEKLAKMIEQLATADKAGMEKSRGNAAIYIDKTPHYVVLAGLLAKVHGGSKFIHSYRSREDMAVSLYFHEFGREFPFARNLNDIKAYLIFHEEAVAAWREAGVDIIDHDHDAFVADTKKRLEGLCAALSMTYTDSLLERSENDEVVRTFSARQVRGDITSAYKGRGMRYKAKLDAVGF